MRDFIAFAKQTCHARLTRASAKLCVDKYVRMRQEGKHSNTVTATTRQLESFMRISEALAKMELSDTVREKHVEEAVRLVKAALGSSFIDKTGRMDLEQMFTGVTHQERQLRQFLVKEIQSTLAVRKSIGIMQLLEHVNGKSDVIISQQSLRESLASLSDEMKISKDGIVSLRE